MTSKDILDLFSEAGYAYTETSYYDDRNFQVVNDLGVGKGRESVDGEIVDEREDQKIEVIIGYFNESTSFGDWWYETVVATPDLLVSVIGNALGEDGAKPPQEFVKAA